MDRRQDDVEHRGPGRIRVVTVNVLSSRFADGPRRLAVIRDELRRLDPDVVALQEVHRAGTPDRDVDGDVGGDVGGDIDEAADLLGPAYHLAPHPALAADGTAAVLASRWPYSRVHARDLDVTPRARAFTWGGVVVAELEVPGLGPLLVAHHKPCWQLDLERERELQAVAAAELVERLARDRPAHAVLLGDLDATPDAACIRFLTGRQSLEGVSVSYHDAWESAHPSGDGATFDPANPLVAAGDMALVRPRRIDYVLVRGTSHGPTLRVDGCRRAVTGGVAGGRPVSDHLGIVADLAVPDRAPGTFADGFAAPEG